VKIISYTLNFTQTNEQAQNPELTIYQIKKPKNAYCSGFPLKEKSITREI
jgi:hypothetical protein